MASYIFRRLIQAIPIMLGISLLIFIIVQAAPGEPIDRFRSPNIRPEQLDQLMRLYGLDKPLWQQYVLWLTAFFSFLFDENAWGFSFTTNQPVRTMIFDRMSATFLLMGTALLVTMIVSIPLGIIAAVKQYSWADKIISSFATIGYAMPSFLLGIYVLFFGGVWLGQVTGGAIYFPLFGRQSLGSDGNPLDIAWHLVLPVTSLAIQSIAGYSRYLRASMLDVLRQDYVRTAKAKGLKRNTVIMKHTFRNAMLPVVTNIALNLPFLFSGAIVTETIFNWKGMGLLFIEGVEARDYFLLMGLILITSTLVIVANLVADVVYAIVDPRIRYD
jgi:peptide/nickel transport system permease protein